MSEQREEQQTNRTASGPPPTSKNGEEGRFYLWVVALAIVLAILLHQSLFEGQGMVTSGGLFNFPPWLSLTNKPSDALLSDQYLVFTPQHEFTHREFMQGKFPLWNPNLDCGEPNLASIQGALLYPINLLLLPVSPFYAAGIAAFLKLFLGGLFTMLYMRLLGVSNSGAFFAALVFSLCGFMMCWLGHPHINCAICIPILLYFIEKTFRYGLGYAAGVTSPQALRVWVGLAIAAGWMFLGGYPPIMVQGGIFLGVYFLFRFIGRWKCQPLPRVILAIGAVVLGFFLAAPAILPFLEYHHFSSMEASSVAMDRAGLHSPPGALILYLFPRLAGSSSEGFEDTTLWLGIARLLPNFVERTGYVGVLTLLFAGCALVFRRGRWTLFYGLVTVVCLLAIYGVPPFPALFEALPILRETDPMRLLVLASFSIAVLAGLGWDSFFRFENHGRRIWMVVGFWAVIGLILLCYWIKVEPRWKYLDAAHRAYLEPQFLMLAGSLAASVALLLPSISRQWQLRSLFGLGWVAVDLLSLWMPLTPALARDAYYPTTPAIEWLQRDKTDFRIIGLGMVFTPDTSQLYSLKDARGYDFVTVRRYEKLVSGNEGSFFFYRTATSLPDTLPLLGVKYVLNFNSPAPDPSLFDLVYSNEITIYRNRGFHERVMPVFDYKVQPDPASVLAAVRSGKFNPQQSLLLEQGPRNSFTSPSSTASTDSSANVVSDQPDEVDVSVSMAKPGFLLLLDTYFPGWKATVNGLESPILRADYNFRAVQLPAGKSEVRFVYEPQSFKWGITLFLVGLTVLIATFLGSFRMSKPAINNPA